MTWLQRGRAKLCDKINEQASLLISQSHRPSFCLEVIFTDGCGCSALSSLHAVVTATLVAYATDLRPRLLQINVTHPLATTPLLLLLVLQYLFAPDCRKVATAASRVAT